MRLEHLAWIPLLSGALAVAQQPPDVLALPPPSASAPRPPDAPPPPRAARPPMERAFHPGMGGRWWNNPEMAQKLALSSEQQRKMDEIFQQHRLKLIDLNAALQKEEAILEPLVESDQPDEPKILAQIDRVAQSRAELEKANARMLLGIRRVLNPDQWKRLQAESSRPRGGPGGGFPAPPPTPRADR